MRLSALRRLIACERGVTMLEYAIIAAAVALACFAAIVPIGVHLATIFTAAAAPFQ